jgi:hypothetical protein
MKTHTLPCEIYLRAIVEASVSDAWWTKTQKALYLGTAKHFPPAETAKHFPPAGMTFNTALFNGLWESQARVQ